MQTLLRAVVMLTVLVAAPMLWIYRGPLPGPAQQVVDEMLADARGWWTGSIAATTLEEAPICRSTHGPWRLRSSRRRQGQRRRPPPRSPNWPSGWSRSWPNSESKGRVSTR